MHKEIEQLKEENAQLKALIEKRAKKKEHQKQLQKKTAKWSWRLFAGESLYKNFNHWFTEYNNKEKVSAKTTASLLTAVTQRFIRIRILSLLLLFFTAIPSLVTLIVLIQQNNLIKIQNALVASSRKSSYNFELANIYNKVDKSGGVLDKNLIARIIGITHSLKPYKILQEDGELSTNLYSNERTQLLLFLLNTNISKHSLQKIFESADFSHCHLKNANLTKKYMEGINLSYANLEGAELHSSNLNNANLTKANLKEILFSNGTANGVLLEDANLTNAKITRTALKDVNLKVAITKNTTITPKK